MKRLIIFISIFAILSSCSDNAESTKSNDPISSGFTISGDLANIPNQTIYLEKIGKGQPVNVDSAIVDTEGKFELSGDASIPDIYILKINNTNLNLLLIEPGEEMNLTGDGSNLQDITVSGSQGTQFLLDLNITIETLQDKLDSFTSIRNEIISDPTKKQQLTQVNNDAQKLIDAHIVYLKKFIRDNSNSLATIAALYQQIGRQRILSLEDDAEIFAFADSALMANFPTSIHVQNLHSGIANSKKQQQQEQMQQSIISVGSIAPDISYPSPSGKEISLSSLRGKYVLIDFWAAWCSPCRRESPTLVSNYNKYNSEGFEIFQVSLDKTKQAWVDAIAKDNLSWPYHVSDLKYWESAPAKLYNVRSIPANFLLDPEGKVIATNLRGQALGSKLAEVFGK